jgi:TorA maturation chaperone TorD
MTAAATGLVTPGANEEGARADLYGLLAQLWLAPPDALLLQQIATAPPPAGDPGAALNGPWQALVAAFGATGVDAAAAEHQALFHGVGKPEILTYASYYLSGFLNERPLVALRSDLAALGLARDDAALETEDHVAYGFEVMRYLIAGDDAVVCNLEQQRRFFRRHLQPWVGQLCDVVTAHPRADTWRAVAALTRAFVEVETQAFDLLEV